jgi:hypothetical protein
VLSACGDPDDDPATQNNICIALCQPGNPNLNCVIGRPQLCAPINEAGTLGGCFPSCTSNAACGEGRVCDIGTGLCADAVGEGGGLGAPCTQATEEADCAGNICLEFGLDDGTTVGFCSATCTFLALAGCGFEADEPSATRGAACLQPALDPPSPGDLGFCLPLCDVDADCAQEGWVCDPEFFPAALAEELGRAGSCIPPELATSGADAGPG